VPLSGQNARRTLFATVDLRTGRRVVMVSRRQRLSDYHRFLRRLRMGAGAKGALWLLLDRHSSHKSPSSLRLAAALNITLVWLPRQCPRLNPVDHLWRGLKNDLAANRQFASMDEQACYAENWVRTREPPSNLTQSRLTLQTLLAQESTQNIVATF
jgi:transposase